MNTHDRWPVDALQDCYPYLNIVNQERTIWPAGTWIRTSRICSASSMRAVTVSSPEIRQIVGDIYRQHLGLPPEWTPTQQETFLEGQAARLTQQIAELADQMGAQAVSDWTQQHGQHPDYLTNVGLLNTAMLAAKEIVLTNELYEMIPEPADPPVPDLDQSPPMVEAGQVPWEQRWTQTRYRTDPSEQIEDLVAHIWPAPDFSAVFRIKAGYLLAARSEDQLPLPAQPTDPLAAQLAAMVYHDLRHDGLPEH